MCEKIYEDVLKETAVRVADLMSERDMVLAKVDEAFVELYPSDDLIKGRSIQEVSDLIDLVDKRMNENKAKSFSKKASEISKKIKLEKYSDEMYHIIYEGINENNPIGNVLVIDDSVGNLLRLRINVRILEMYLNTLEVSALMMVISDMFGENALIGFIFP